MKNLESTAAALLLIGLGGAAHAGTVIQAQAFDYTFTAFVDGPDETQPFYPSYPSPLTATFAPFNATLGALVDTTVTWQAGFSFSGVADANSVGSLGGSFGGQFGVNGAGYSGDGNDGGNGTFPGGSFSVNFSVGPDSTTFVSSEAGIDYDPAILAAFQGPSPFTADYAIAAQPYRYDHIASGSASFSGSVTVTYDYAGSPTPEPTSWALLLVGFAGLGATMRGRRRAASPT